MMVGLFLACGLVESPWSSPWAAHMVLVSFSDEHELTQAVLGNTPDRSMCAQAWEGSYDCEMVAGTWGCLNCSLAVKANLHCSTATFHQSPPAP